MDPGTNETLISATVLQHLESTLSSQMLQEVEQKNENLFQNWTTINANDNSYVTITAQSLKEIMDKCQKEMARLANPIKTFVEGFTLPYFYHVPIRVRNFEDMRPIQRVHDTMYFYRSSPSVWKDGKTRWHRLVKKLFDQHPDVNSIHISAKAATKHPNNYKFAKRYTTEELVQGKGFVKVEKYVGDIVYYRRGGRGQKARRVVYAGV